MFSEWQNVYFNSDIKQDKSDIYQVYAQDKAKNEWQTVRRIIPSSVPTLLTR